MCSSQLLKSRKVVQLAVMMKKMSLIRELISSFTALDSMKMRNMKLQRPKVQQQIIVPLTQHGQEKSSKKRLQIYPE